MLLPKSPSSLKSNEAYVSRILAIFVRQIFLISTNPTRLASIFLWLIIDILQWGFISRYLASLGRDTFSFITVILGAVILWEFMSRIQQGILMGFMEDIWTQNLINLFASPLKIREYLTGLVLTSLSTGIISFLIMALLAGTIFSYNILKIGLLIIPFMTILLIFGIAMGIFVTAMIFRLGPTAEWLGWPVPIVLSLFSGVFFPISTLPEWMRVFAMFIPASYIFEALRAIITIGNYNHTIIHGLIISALLSLAYILATSLFFLHVYHRNLKEGNISRFNAEVL